MSKKNYDNHNRWRNKTVAFRVSAEEYLQLSELNVSQPLRGQGIGRELFRLACEQARTRGAQKLYLSAHSAEETQAFYRAMGCVEAAWYHPELVALEPCDCQMEFLL